MAWCAIISVRPQRGRAPDLERRPALVPTSAARRNWCQRVGPRRRRRVARRRGRMPARPRCVQSGRCPRSGMSRDRIGSIGGAAGKQCEDRVGEFGVEPLILVGAACLIPFPAAGAQLGIGKAFLFGKLDGFGLRQDALALVAFARSAPPHYYRRKAAGRLRPPRHRGVAGRQEFEMSEVGAVQAQRSWVLHEEKASGTTAQRARPVLDW